MRKRMIMPILIGLALILSTFVSSVSIVQKIAYAQARTQPNNGVPSPNSMNLASSVLGSNGGSAVQGVAGTLSSVHVTSAKNAIVAIGTLKTILSFGFGVAAVAAFHAHKNNPS